MGIANANMETFLTGLFTERATISSCPDKPVTDKSVPDTTTNSFCVIVDNAQGHNQRWSRLPRRIRSQMSPRDLKLSNSRWESNTGSSSPHLTRRVRRNSHTVHAPPPPAAAAAAVIDAVHVPPCCPQRQQSIGEPSSNNAIIALPRVPQRKRSMEDTSTTHNDDDDDNNNRLSSLSLVPPQRKVSIDVSYLSHTSIGRSDITTESVISSISSPKYPQRQHSNELYSGGTVEHYYPPKQHHNNNNNNSMMMMKAPSSLLRANNGNQSSKLGGVPEELASPRMPTRKLSNDPTLSICHDTGNTNNNNNNILDNDAAGENTIIPLPPAFSTTTSLVGPPTNTIIERDDHSTVKLAGQCFTTVIKRTRASLLDDDDDDDTDDDSENDEELKAVIQMSLHER